MIRIDGNKEENVFTFVLEGRLDALATAEVEDKIFGWIKKGEVRLVGNLSGLEYISSSGLHVLLQTARDLEEKNGKLVLYGATESIREIFSVVKLDWVISSAATKDEAIQSF